MTMTAEIVELAKKIADHLGDNWTHREQDEFSHVIYLDHADGSGMTMRLYNGRLSISGQYPSSVTDGDNVLHFYPHSSEDRVNITVSPDRSAEAIAKDIQRRFLPGYWAVYLEMVAQKQRQLDFIEQREVILKELGRALGIAPRKGEIKFPYHGAHQPHGTIKISLYQDIATVHFDVSGVPVETALEIAALLRQKKVRKANEDRSTETRVA